MAKKKSKSNLKSKWLFIVGAFVVLFVIFYSALPKQTIAPTRTTNNSSSETANWKTYTSSFDSFTIKYPPSLEILEDRYNGKVFRVFIQSDKFQIVIHPDGLSGEASLEAYRNNLETTGANQFVSYKISGEDALKFHIRAKSEDEIQIVTIHNGKSYLITASPSNLSNASSLDQILSTFKFTDSGGAFCGGFAANLPEYQCPSGYKCQLDGNYPDAGGKCVKQ